jgi:hypothetical protein
MCGIVGIFARKTQIPPAFAIGFLMSVSDEDRLTETHFGVFRSVGGPKK